MAENKKSFILYADLLNIVNDLPDEIAGKLFKIILLYVNDQEVCVEDLLLKIAFGPIKAQLKRDLIKYEGIKSFRSKIGKEGGIKSAEAKASKCKQKQPNASTVQANQADNVNVNDTVTVNDNVKESNTPDLSKSNLFRKPKIPTQEEVNQAFLSSGGTKEMAEVFYQKNSAVGWFYKGSPITNFKNFLPNFITNWNANNRKNKDPGNGKSITFDRA